MNTQIKWLVAIVAQDNPDGARAIVEAWARARTARRQRN